MENNLKQKTLIGVIWSSIDIVTNQLVTLIVQIILARLLVPEEFGIIGIVLAFTAIAQIIVDSGFSNALIRENETTEEDYSTVFYYNVIASFVIYGIIFIAAKYVGIFYDDMILEPVLKVLSVSIIINSFSMVQRTLTVKNIQFKVQTLINSIATILSGVVAIILAYYKLGVWSLVAYTLARSIIQSILYIFTIRWKPMLIFRKSSFLKYFSFGWKVLASSLIDTVYANINNFVIGKLYSKVVLGYYSNSNRFSSLIQGSIYSIVGKVSYPVLGKLQSDEVTLKKGYKKIVAYTAFINFPAIIGLIAIAEPFVMFLLGEKWSESIVYLRIISIPGIIYPLQALNLSILQVKGRSDLYLKCTLVKKITGIIFISLIIIFKLDIIILLWIGVVDSIITYIINSSYASKVFDYTMKEQIKDVSLNLIVATIMGIAVFGLINIINVGYFLQIVIAVFSGAILYLLLCKLLNIVIFSEVLGLLKSILKKK